MYRILLLLSLIVCTHASEIDEWMDRVFKNEFVAARYIMDRKPEHRAFQDELYKNAKMAIYNDSVIPMNSKIELKDGQLSINGKSLSFKALEQDNFGKHGAVLRFDFTLDQAEPISIWEVDTRHYNFQAIFVNGERLERSIYRSWSPTNRADFSILGKKGTNTVIAIPSETTEKFKAYTLQIFKGHVSDGAKKLGQQHLILGNEEAGHHFRQIMDYMVGIGWLSDGRPLADGFFYYLQCNTEKTDQKEEDRRRADIGHLTRHIANNIHDRAKVHFLEHLRSRAPRWLRYHMYSHRGNPEWHSFNQHIESIARLGDGDDVLEHIRFFLDGQGKKTDDKKFQAQLRDSYIHLIVNTLRFNSLFDTAIELGKRMEELPNYSSKDWRGRHKKEYVGYAEQRIQAKAQLAGNPEAQQYYTEFELLIKRGAEDERAVDSMVTLFRRAGPKMLVIDNNMRNLGAEMLYELERDKDFHAAVVKRAHEQFHSRVNLALQRGNLEEMGSLIQTYGLLIRTDAIHKSLMDEYLDRCYYDKARYHALRLVDSQDKTLRVDAFSKVLLIEDILQMSQDERTYIPNKLHKESVTVAGTQKSLGDIIKEFNGRSSKSTKQDLGPGNLIMSATLGIPNLIHNAGNGEFLDNQPYEKQGVEPISLNDTVFISSPTYIHAINTKTKQKTWALNQEVSFQPNSSGITSVEYPASIVNGNIVRLWAKPDGRGLTIRAFNQDGKVVWDFYDHQENKIWSPVSTPNRAFGLLYTVVYNNTVRDQIQFSLVQLNTSNGRIEENIPLNTMFRDFEVQKSRHGQHFYSDEHNLYGLSGSGTLFKLNQKNLKLEWVAGKTLRSMRHYINPAAYVKPYSDTVVSYMPNLQEFIGVSTRSGLPKWRWKTTDTAYIHTRNSETYFIVSDERNSLTGIDPTSGAFLWRVNALNLKITGEGCTLNETLYLPCNSGIAKFSCKDGAFIGLDNTPYVPNKIRRDQSFWYILSSTDIHIHAYGETFNNSGNQISESVFNEAPLKSVTQQQAYDETGLFIARSLSAPIIIDEYTKLRETSVPHYHLIDRHREQGIALYREAHTDANGKKVGDQIIWAGSKKRYNLEGDKLILWNAKEFRIERIPNKEVLLQGDLHTEYKFGGACDITVFGNKCILFAGPRPEHLKQIIEIDLKTKLPVKSLPSPGRLLMIKDDFYLINQDKEKQVVCYNLKDHSVRWTYKDDKHRSSAHYAGPNTLLIGHHDKFAIVREDNGKAIYKYLNTRSVDGTVISDYFIYNSSGAYNYKTKKGLKDLQKILVDPKVGAAIKYQNKPFIWYDKDGSVELSAPFWHVTGVLAEARHGGRAQLKNGVIHLFTLSTWACFDRKSGELIAQERLSHDQGRFLACLDNSLCLLSGGQLHAVRGKQSFDWEITFPYVTETNEFNWPTQNWTKPEIIKPNYWIPFGDSKPRHKYAYQIGRDDDHVYVRLITSAARSSNDNRTLKVSLEYKEENEKNFDVDWNIDRSEQGVTDSARAKRFNSWKQIDSKGNIHCYMIFNKSDIQHDWHRGYSPRIHMELIEYNSGSYNGRFMLGGIAERGTVHKFGYLSSNRIMPINTGENYQLRQRVYEQSEDFYPQGRTLANWIKSRRPAHGHDDNIALLKDMLKRCKSSSAAPNVLACLLWEHLDKWYHQNPHKADNDPDFLNFRSKIVKELAQFCDQSGIDKNIRDYGLSFFEIHAFPYGNYHFCINATYTGGNRKDRHGLGINTKNDSMFVRHHDRPFMYHLLIGLYDSHPPTNIEKLHFRDPACFFGPISFHSPNKETVLIDQDLNYQNGCKPPTDGRNQQGNDKNVRYAYNGQVLKAKDFSRGNRSFDLYFNEIELPKIEKSKFTSDDLLLMLNNLPSDSEIGLNLAWAYFSVTPEEKRKDAAEIYNIVLRQVGKNLQNQLVYQTIEHLYNHYRSQKLPNKQVFNKLKEDMKESNIPRSVQRRMFTKFNNNLIGSGRWYHLGVIKKEKEIFLKPAPEVIDIDNLFTTDFTYGDKKYRFETSTDKMPEARVSSRYRIHNNSERESTLSYHYMKFDLTEKKKIWLYLRQGNPNRYGAGIGIWVDGEEIFNDSIKHGDYNPIAIPHRLDAGTHNILIKYDFKRGWDLEFAIGDSYGLPLEIVELPRLIPIQ